LIGTLSENLSCGHASCRSPASLRCVRVRRITEAIYRSESGRILATLVRLLRRRARFDSTQTDLALD